jgi:hypothetical protein
MPNACATCGSTMGFFKGPNGYARCLNCMHDQDFKDLPADPSVSPEPNTQVDDKAQDSPTVMTTKGNVRDKAVRGPKEQKTS